jgi:hypothetical protein
MTEKKFVKRWCVNLTEYERGWGSKMFHQELFKTFEEACKYRDTENDKNDLPYVPDYYIVAGDPFETYVDDDGNTE